MNLTTCSILVIFVVWLAVGSVSSDRYSLSVYCCSTTCSTDPTKCKAENSYSVDVSFRLHLSVSNASCNGDESYCTQKVAFFARQYGAAWNEMIAFHSKPCHLVLVGNKQDSVLHINVSSPLSVTVHLYDYWIVTKHQTLQFGWFGDYSLDNKCSHLMTKNNGWWISDIAISEDGASLLREMFDGSITESASWTLVSKNANVMKVESGRNVLFFRRPYLIQNGSVKDYLVSKMLQLASDGVAENKMSKREPFKKVNYEHLIVERMASGSKKSGKKSNSNNGSNNSNSNSNSNSNNNNNGCDESGNCNCNGLGNDNCNGSSESTISPETTTLISTPNNETTTPTPSIETTPPGEVTTSSQAMPTITTGTESTTRSTTQEVSSRPMSDSTATEATTIQYPPPSTTTSEVEPTRVSTAGQTTGTQPTAEPETTPCTECQNPEVEALISDKMKELETLFADVMNHTVEPLATIDRLTSVINALLSQPLLVSTIAINENQFILVIDELLHDIEGLPKAQRSSAASEVLQLLDLTALRLFSDGQFQRGSLEALVVTMNVSESSLLPVLEVNGTSIKVPRAVINQTANEQTTVRMASIHFRDLKHVLLENENSSLASPVISAAFLCGESICDTSAKALETNLNPPVRITLRNSKDPSKNENEPRCSFWEFSREKNDGYWNQDGCSLSNVSNSTFSVCECNHLTHFAILLSAGANFPDADQIALTAIGYVGFSISALALSMTVLIYICFKTLWSMRSYIHIHLCVTTLVSQFVFIVAVDKTDNRIGCAVSAVLLHYLFLVSFMWMLMEGVVLYVVLVRVFVKSTLTKYYILTFTLLSYEAELRQTKNRTGFYSLYSIRIPLLYMCFIALPMGFLLNGTWHYGYGEPELIACWLRYDTHFIWVFIVPVLLIIMINICFFIMAIAIMRKHDVRNHDQRDKKAAVKQWLKASITLVVVMGLTWIIGVLVFNEALLPVAYIFTIFVAFQGVAIFIVLVPMSAQVRKAFITWARDQVNKSSFLSTHFADKLESWMSRSRRDTNPDPPKKNDSLPQYQLGTFGNSGGESTPPKINSNDHVLENPTYDKNNWNLDAIKTALPTKKENHNNDMNHHLSHPTQPNVELTNENVYESILTLPGVSQTEVCVTVPEDYCVPVSSAVNVQDTARDDSDYAAIEGVTK